MRIQLMQLLQWYSILSPTCLQGAGELSLAAPKMAASLLLQLAHLWKLELSSLGAQLRNVQLISLAGTHTHAVRCST
jgi:hypothetical protein